MFGPFGVALIQHFPIFDSSRALMSRIIVALPSIKGCGAYSGTGGIFSNKKRHRTEEYGYVPHQRA